MTPPPKDVLELIGPEKMVLGQKGLEVKPKNPELLRTRPTTFNAQAVVDVQ